MENEKHTSVPDTFVRIAVVIGLFLLSGLSMNSAGQVEAYELNVIRNNVIQELRQQYATDAEVYSHYVNRAISAEESSASNKQSMFIVVSLGSFLFAIFQTYVVIRMIFGIGSANAIVLLLIAIAVLIAIFAFLAHIAIPIIIAIVILGSIFGALGGGEIIAILFIRK